jgi:hypothetical protein
MFWLRWVAANAAGELVGLGGTALLAALLFTRMGGDASSVPATLTGAALVVAAGALVEGMAVGGAQWVVLRRALPGLSGRRWMGMTALGAGVAWALGMVPSTLMSIASDGPQSAAPPAEPSEAVVYALAALMGLALGPVLGLPQWLALRRHVAHAGWWIAANALAWALGMPIIFAGVSLVVDGHGPLAARAGGAAGTLALAGAVVGAVHGLFLLRLLRGTRR